VIKKQSNREHIASNITSRFDFVFDVLMHAETINNFINEMIAVVIIADLGKSIPNANDMLFDMKSIEW